MTARRSRRFAGKFNLYVAAAILVGAVVAAGVYVSGSHRPAPRADTPCPCSLFGTPGGYADFTDASGLELGLRFKSAASGYVTGVKFYKDATMTGSHTGNLWDNNGNILATVAYTGETATGWQEAAFSAPVAVTAGQMYVVSTYMPDGHYLATTNAFTSAVTNGVLTAYADSATDALGNPGNGVFVRSAVSAYPTASGSGVNYWIDPVFRATIDATPPAIAAVSPLNGATGFSPANTLNATFTQPMLGSSLSVSTISLKAGAVTAPITVSYDAASQVVTLTPTSPLAGNTAYSVTLAGGAGNVENLDGTPLAADYTWTFTTGSDVATTHNTQWNRTTSGLVGTSTTEARAELGNQFTADANGFIQSLRFYKSVLTTVTSHTGHVWDADGTLLATVSFTHESSSGWQEERLSVPLHILQNHAYIISYDDGDQIYTYTAGGLTAAVNAGPLHIPANGGRFKYGTGQFPNVSSNLNYWVDAVVTDLPVYALPVEVAVSQPVAQAYGVAADHAVTAQFTNALNPATVSGANFSLKRTSDNQAVTAAAAYDSLTRTAKLTPGSALSAGETYTATLTTGIADVYGTALAQPYTWSFTVGVPAAVKLTTGEGGPILIVTSGTNHYANYLGEMLRAEGLNYFDIKDINTVDATMLANYQVVLLGAMNVSVGQVSMFTNWVTGGGNLVAMRPDKQFAGLLGLTDLGTTVSEGYIKVNTGVSPGAGISAETMQYHGAADVYQNDSAQADAELYSDAVTDASAPALVEKAVGSAGGNAAAFTYDLPQAITLLHQGNPALVNQNVVDGGSLYRPDNLFHNGSGTDWLNTANSDIPQADEQQRLLVNLITKLEAPRTPLPRFGSLPHGYKAAVVMSGDDHATPAGTQTTMDYQLNNSPSDCSLDDWTCVRSTSFMYPNTPLAQGTAALFQSEGFALSSHINTGCLSPVAGTYTNTFTSELANFTAAFPGLAIQRTSRVHCYAWRDYTTPVAADLSHGIRYDLEYEWYPASWTGANAGYLTGSGQTMRFVDSSGNLLDAYQGVTDLDYETDPSSTSMNSLLDNATGSRQYFGVFGTHYDYGNAYDTQLVAAAKAHNVPLVSTEQVLTWRDALGSSSFQGINYGGGQLRFTAVIAAGGSGMQAMIPQHDNTGTLAAVTRDGHAVPYTISTIKGVLYAVLDAAPGAYIATYSDHTYTADLNNDGKIDLVDLSLMLNNWGGIGMGDIDVNGKVDVYDLSRLLGNWTQ